MDAVSLTRRSFLRGRASRVEPAQRPPWALDEAAFLECCTRCDACLDACSGAILTRGGGGFPKVDFGRGECTFCGDCAAQCESGALFRQQDVAPWALRAVFGGACLAMHGVECRVCGEMCGRSAIRFRPRIGGVALPELDAVSCTGCGACVAPCPAHALTMEKMG